MDIFIRNEMEKDYRQVEELTREAFWNLYIPGCNEHYLVHIMRDHPDFISKLDFVAIYKEKIIGNIMYSKSYVMDKNDSNHKIDTITFGPVCVLPEYQRKGVGSSLIEDVKSISEKCEFARFAPKNDSGEAEHELYDKCLKVIVNLENSITSKKKKKYD